MDKGERAKGEGEQEGLAKTVNVQEGAPEEAREVAEAEEVEKPPKEVEEVVEERFYTISLGRAWLAPSNKRAPKAMKMIRDFIRKHMKLEAKEGAEEEKGPKKLVISNEVNERVWGRGVRKPPRRIRVRATKDKDGNVTVYLAEGG